MKQWQAFLALPRPSAPGSYSVDSSSQVYRVARSYEGYPAMLFALTSDVSGSVARRLEVIAYQPPQTIELSRSGSLVETARLAVLECRSSDPQLGAYFFRIVGSVLLEGDGLIGEAGFESALDAVVTLFRALHRPGRRAIQGLWAELAIITWADDPARALGAWHSEPHALHDFAVGSFRLEIKSTQKRTREHQFLLDQLGATSPGATIIASVLLVEAADGISVLDLLDVIVEHVGAGSDAARRLEAVVAESLGLAWRDADDTRFSIERARQDLQLYRAEDVPTVPQPLPTHVKNVQFTADLSGVPPLELAAARALGVPFQAMLPRE